MIPRHTRLGPVLASALLAGLGACKKVEPAPEDLDALFHYGWAHFEAEGDEELAGAVVNLHAALEDGALEETLDGSVSSLSAEEVALVGLDAVSPGEAAGMFIARPLACDLDTLAQILVEPDQDALYTGVYDAYSRDYHADTADFTSGEALTLSWELTYTASLLGATYEATTAGMLRRVPVLDEELSPHGESIWFRSVMPEPATFEGDSKKYLDQDYQLEAFWEPEPGRLLHVYAMWREANYGSGYDTDSEGVQRIIMNNMAKWDDTTEELCAEGW